MARFQFTSFVFTSHHIWYTLSYPQYEERSIPGLDHYRELARHRTCFNPACLSQGHRVVATSRNPCRTPDLVAEVEQQGGKWIALDLTDGDLEGKVTSAQEIFGRIDVVVNCAGYALMSAVEDTPISKVMEQMHINFYGPHRIIRTLLPTMRKRRSGTIINVSSSQTFLPAPVTSIYGASKAALDTYTESLHQEVQGFGIKVLLVRPGAFRTAFATGGSERIPLSEEYAKDDHPIMKNLAWMGTLPELAPGSPELGAKVIFEAANGDHKYFQLLIGGSCWRAANIHKERLQHVLDTQKELAESADYGEQD